MANPSSRPIRTSRGYLLRGLFVAGFLLLIGWLVVRNLPKNEVDTTDISPSPITSHPVANSTDPVPPAPKHAEEQAEESATHLDLSAVQPAICEILGRGPAGNRPLGTGVFVDSTGSVLTCLHVITETTDPAVRLADGTILDVAGYRWIDPRLDLALVVARNSPRTTPLRWSSLVDPPTDSISLPQSVFAVGHPTHQARSILSGTWTAIVSPADLLTDERDFLQTLLPSSVLSVETTNVEANGATTDARRIPTDPSTWLLHTVPITPGFSGGPLLNRQGEAIGLNVWVNETQERSFALPMRQVRAFLDQAANVSAELIPPREVASPAARQRMRRWRMSGEQLRKLLDSSQAMHWQPASWNDYQLLQQLAFGLNLARDDAFLAATGDASGDIESLAKAAQPVMQSLASERWNDVGQLLLINEFAHSALNEIETGWIGFVSVREILAETERELIVCVQLSGFEDPFLVILDRTLSPPAVGTQWLLLGVQRPNRSEHEGKALPTLVSHVILPFQAKP